jgi:hypothetical protein
MIDQQMKMLDELNAPVIDENSPILIDTSQELKDLEAQIASIFNSAPSVVTPTLSAEQIKAVYQPINKNPPLDLNSFGIKFDSEKLDWSLLPLQPVEDIIKVLMHGAKKYKVDNWKIVDDYDRRYFNAAMRHLSAWKQNELNDPETGISHLAHAACNILFLLSTHREIK